MCLDKIIYAGSEASEHANTDIGYKIFERKKNGHLRGMYYADNFTRPYNKWLHEKDYRDSSDPTIWNGLITLFPTLGGSYPAGWHVYIAPESSLLFSRYGVVPYNLAIKQVKMKDIVAIGEQCYQLNTSMFIIYVCKQIKILKP